MKLITGKSKFENVYLSVDSNERISRRLISNFRLERLLEANVFLIWLRASRALSHCPLQPKRSTEAFFEKKKKRDIELWVFSKRPHHPISCQKKKKKHDGFAKMLYNKVSMI